MHWARQPQRFRVRTSCHLRQQLRCNKCNSNSSNNNSSSSIISLITITNTMLLQQPFPNTSCSRLLRPRPYKHSCKVFKQLLKLPINSSISINISETTTRFQVLASSSSNNSNSNSSISRTAITTITNN